MSERPSPFDRAEAFCREVGASDLLAYLALPPDASAEEAQARLHEQRRRLQGLQAHPRHKREARSFIANYAALKDALSDLEAYRQEAMRRSRSVHLPVLEMTMRAVLAKGRLSPDDEAYLSRNAAELGVDEEDYRDLLARVAGELGVRLHTIPTKLSNTDPSTVPTGRPARARGTTPDVLAAMPRVPSPPEDKPVPKRFPVWAIGVIGFVVGLLIVAFVLFR
ncbi:MAG: hypothetical protein AAGA48_09885 [Myxococcota bacterium]